MKLSLNWIKQYVDLPQDLSMKKLSYDLTMRTVEVEDIFNPAEALKGVVAGKILSVGPHPQADKLRICTVDVGKETPSVIVCGGSNLEVGMMVVVAVPGAWVRWHGEGEPVEIKPAKLRGVLSEGMICAADELDMGDLFPASDDHEIMDITAFQPQPGDLVKDVLGLDDMVLEIDNKSMTNRPDLWGHYGIARELAAIYELPLKPLPTFALPQSLPAFPVDNQAPERCLRYAGLHYTGIENVPSPYAVKLALWKCGLRAINAPVDLTNYVMLAVGQPLHGFDRTRVEGGIVVRTAQAGETLTMLDGQKLTLRGSDLVIADHKHPMALAGIMGGEEDSILPGTTEMLLEIANFAPTPIRKTANHFAIHTDSSARNEKGLDVERVDCAMALANEMILSLFPNARLIAAADVGQKQTPAIRIPVPLSWLSTRLGRPLTQSEAAHHLTKLGFALTAEGDTLQITVPSYRATGDIAMPDDILEEVARMIGYENFTFIPPTVALDKAVHQKDVSLDRAIREALAFRHGIQEIFTYPWVDERYLEACGINVNSCLALHQPPSPETAHLRPSLVPGMLQAVIKNIKYFDQFALFEVAQTFLPGQTHPSEEEETLPLMQKKLCIALVDKDARALFYRAKGIVEALPRQVMMKPLAFRQDERPLYADAKAWLNILAGDTAVGSLGLVSLKAQKLTGIKRVQVAVIEINMDALTPLDSRTNTFEHLPLFPLVEQDFSVLIDESGKWQDLVALIHNHVKGYRFMEEYKGAQVPEGKKSLMFRVWFHSDTGTLTQEQIEEKKNALLKRIQKRLGGEIRS